MITMQQLEELESRIIKALQLIGDLRAENAKLESDNESLKVQAEEARLSLEEKEQEIARLKKEIESATAELAQIKQREEVLEKKIIEMLGKLDTLKSGKAAPAFDVKPQPQASQPKPKPVEDFLEEKPGDEEDIIIIDDTETAKGDVEVDTLPTAEDEIVLLDDTDEEIVIDDVEGDLIIIDEETTEKKSSKESKDKVSDDEDFIIIEDDEK